jgi:hypothetical protein
MVNSVSMPNGVICLPIASIVIVKNTLSLHAKNVLNFDVGTAMLSDMCVKNAHGKM